MAKPPFNKQNPVRHEDLELLLTVLAQKLLDEIYSGTSRPSYTAKEIARETVDEVYRR